jgi:hypothetical protein
MKITYESDSDDDNTPLPAGRHFPSFASFDESDSDDDSIPPPAFSSRYEYLPSTTVDAVYESDDDDDSIPPRASQ